jgi:hypothetical protein
MTENEKDIELLHKNPNALVLKYHETVKIIVKKFILAGIITRADFEDTVQEVLAGVLAKIPTMQKQYNGMSLFRTYFSVIVRNTCMREFAKTKRRIAVEQVEFPDDTEGVSIDKRILIGEEICRFKSVLTLYYKQRPKLLVCLKLHYRIPLNVEDIHLWYPDCSQSDRAILLENFGSDFEAKGDAEVYKIITLIMNKHENKKNSADAVRKWIDSKVYEIIDIMNGTCKRSNYDDESLKTLVDDFFSPFLRDQ